MDDDERIKSFFREMKKSDEQMTVPPFSKRDGLVRRREQRVFLYAAASVAVFLAIVFFVRHNANNNFQKDEMVILIGEDPLKTNSLLEVNEKSLIEWESPTSFLSEDF